MSPTYRPERLLGRPGILDRIERHDRLMLTVSEIDEEKPPISVRLASGGDDVVLNPAIQFLDVRPVDRVGDDAGAHPHRTTSQ